MRAGWEAEGDLLPSPVFLSAYESMDFGWDTGASMKGRLEKTFRHSLQLILFAHIQTRLTRGWVAEIKCQPNISSNMKTWSWSVLRMDAVALLIINYKKLQSKYPFRSELEIPVKNRVSTIPRVQIKSKVSSLEYCLFWKGQAATSGRRHCISPAESTMRRTIVSRHPQITVLISRPTFSWKNWINVHTTQETIQSYLYTSYTNLLTFDQAERFWRQSEHDLKRRDTFFVSKVCFKALLYYRRHFTLRGPPVVIKNFGFSDFMCWRFKILQFQKVGAVTLLKFCTHRCVFKGICYLFDNKNVTNFDK